ncbi:hypothetical protein [Defluviimonas sp. WL0075]|uniref:Uncharacterized protein n=1 Tax=Albidovulum sediminicola TaxID=2984331 RepID=A0ABT2YZX6_9RHOB|nr:hypothetical protein [Defluviimonas sp. WL0075]MCV2864444.1 hypothetical protein [Defluviimonas sp. WL0075]
MRVRVFGMVSALILASGPVLAGGMAEPIMEQEPVIEQASSSRAGIIIPLLLLLFVAAAASSGGSTPVPIPD